MGGRLPERTTCGWATLSRSARRAEPSSCKSGVGPVALLSAGIGATPVLAMLYALVVGAFDASGARGCTLRATESIFRSPRRFGAWSRTWRAAAAMSVSASPRPPTGSERTLRPRAISRGRRSTRLGLTPDADVYLCGPAALHGGHEGGPGGAWRGPERIHIEIFSGGESLTPGVAGGATKLRIGRRPTSKRAPSSRSRAAASLPTGIRRPMQSLLELAEACDVPVRWACRTGVCHNCESGLVSGEVAYDPQPLDLPATGNLLICCSRPAGDVVVDL